MFKLVYNLCFSILYAVIVIVVARKEGLLEILVALLAIQYSFNQILNNIKEME